MAKRPRGFPSAGSPPSRMRGPGALRVAAWLSLLLVPSLLHAQYVVLDDTHHIGEKPLKPAGRDTLPEALLSSACGLFPTAWYGEPVPGGGFLVPGARSSTVAVNARGQAAFFSNVSGSPRNQGIFMKDESGLHPIAIGCGGRLGSGDPGTGCGDPSPVGGTFSGFDPSSVAPPAINEAGDILFLADVFGGAYPRGLFLYRASGGDIRLVAAIGGLAPMGLLAAVGPGSLNDNGEVVFTAGTTPANNGMSVLRWHDGTMQVVISPGQAVPGGIVATLVWAGLNLSDGTFLPVREFADINNAGTVSFWASLQNSSVGLYVLRNGVYERYIGSNDPSPVGGQFFGFHAPILNDVDEIAFVGQYLIDPWTIGWFVGRPGAWREVLSFRDPIDGGESVGIAASSNPAQPLDDDGNLILWADVRFGPDSTAHYLLVGHADGKIEVIAKTGDAVPPGGTIQEIGPWPTRWGRRCAFGSLTGGASSAYTEFMDRPLAVAGLMVDLPVPGTGDTPISWDPQPSPDDDSGRHDLLRGRLDDFGTAAECAVDGLKGNSWNDPEAACRADEGSGCWYLVRAEDTCGKGPYGSGNRACIDSCDGGLIPGCPICGNDVLDPMEECDGPELGGETCVTVGFDDGVLACTAECTHDTSGCTTVCGDGMIRGDEECDGTNLGGFHCTQLGFDAGALACGSDCAFDLTGCCCNDGTPGCPVCPVCGNGVREAPYELCDGSDTGPETCTSQGRLPGELGCTFFCDAFDYSGCVGH